MKFVDLPAQGSINHHWTRKPDRESRRRQVVRHGRLEQQRWGERHPAEDKRAAIWEIDRATGESACSHRGCATRTAWTGSRRVACCGLVVNERDEIGPNLVPDCLTSSSGRRLLRLAVQLLWQEPGRAG